MNMPIAVNYAALEEAANAMRNASKTIEDRLNELDGQLKKIQWIGDDREAYLAHKHKWDMAIQDMHNLLHQIGGAVETARQAYGSVEKAGADAWA